MNRTGKGVLRITYILITFISIFIPLAWWLMRLLQLTFPHSYIYIYSKLHAKSAIYKICFEFYKMSLLNSNLLFKRVGFVVLMMYSAIGHLSMEFKRNFSYKHINMKFVFSLPSNGFQDANNYKVYSVECTTCSWLIRRRWGQATQLLVIFKWRRWFVRNDNHRNV